MTIYLHMQKRNKILVVRFDPVRYHHDVFENGEHLGRIRMREFLFDGWKCVKREVLDDSL